MLVDDDEVDLLQVQRLIDHDGGFGPVTSFRRPEEALRFLSGEDRPAIDLLFVDIKMPGMSGFEFLKRARATIGAEFVGAVIVLTTLSLPEMHLERATTDDLVKAFLKKPLTGKDLERARRISTAVQFGGSDASGVEAVS